MQYIHPAYIWVRLDHHLTYKGATSPKTRVTPEASRPDGS